MSVIIVTGAAGLIGSETCKRFHKEGLQIVGIDNDMRARFFGPEASTKNTRKSLEGSLKNYQHFEADIRDFAAIEGVFKKLGKDVKAVVHTAAQPSHDWAAREPHTDFGVNATGTLNMLEATRLHCAEAAFIFTSTNKVYGDTPNRLPLEEKEKRWEIQASHPFWTGIDETMSIDQTKHSLFGASKVAADVLVQEYGRYFGMKTVCFRGGCLTGPAHAGTELHGFLAYLMKCTVAGKPYRVFGYKGKQVRDNIHSHDLVEAFWQFISAPRSGEVYNMGGSRHSNCSMLEAIEFCQQISGKKLDWTYVEDNRIGDHIWWVSDVRKFQGHYPQWKYKYDLKGILKEIHAACVSSFTVKILISGICGFVGSTIAARLKQQLSGVEVFGFDNFIRPGSELNRRELKRMGIRVQHSDVRSAADIGTLAAADWVIDAAANPSVLAGVDGQTSSRQLVEHNLYGTINLLEYCKQHKAGFILLSTSRVYAIKPLADLKVKAVDKAFRPGGAKLPKGVSTAGVSEEFSTEAPISLYGSTKLASEAMALEYGDTFNFPVWINRCGVLAGAGQFGRPDQGIFSYWINSWLRQRPLKYIGFGGKGFQVRDCLHPHDVVSLLLKQIGTADKKRPRIVNVSGGAKSATSLAQLSKWCAERFGAHKVQPDSTPRPFDIPWMVLNSALASKIWKWQPETPVENILDEIARHAEGHPDWLDLSAP